MTEPQIIMALWLVVTPIIDMVQNGKDKCSGWHLGRLIGHTISILLVYSILHWGGFWR